MKGLWAALALAAAPAMAIPPPPPPPNLYHFKVEGIAIECQRKPGGTRLELCRILTGESGINIQIQRWREVGQYYFWATRPCTLDEAGTPASNLRTGMVQAGQLEQSGLPRALEELQALPLDPACAPVAEPAKMPADLVVRLDKALTVLDNLWRE